MGLRRRKGTRHPITLAKAPGIVLPILALSSPDAEVYSTKKVYSCQHVEHTEAPRIFDSVNLPKRTRTGP